MDDFLHHLIVVAAFATAAVLAKLAVWALAMAGPLEFLQSFSSACQLSAGLVAASVAHYRTLAQPAARLAQPRA